MTIRARVEYDGQGRATSADVEWDGSAMPGEMASMHVILDRMLMFIPDLPTLRPADGLSPMDDLREPSGVLCRRYICQHSRDVHTKGGCQACDAPGKCPEYVGLSETVLP